MKYLLIVLALLIAISGCAVSKAQTTAPKIDAPGENRIIGKSAIDPYKVSDTWTHVNTASMGGYPLLFFLNPDVTAKIQYVAVMFYYDLILAYAYIFDNEVCLFILDRETGEYPRHDCNEENWKETFRQFTTNNPNSI